MSLTPTDTSIAGPSRLPAQAPDQRSLSYIFDHTPSCVISYSLAGGVMGFVIGAKRGGSRARLKFLAENAHRPPKTRGGWYYYLRARNYLMIKNGTLKGMKYALALGTGTAVYALLDEGVGWYREELGDLVPRDIKDEDMRRYTWRRGEVRVYDGTIAGGVLGAGIGVLWRLPRTLFLRSILLGIMLGTLESGLQLLRDKVESGAAEEVREAQAKQAAEQAEKEREEEEVLTDAQRGRLRTLRGTGDLSAKDRRKVVEEMVEETRLKRVAFKVSNAQKSQSEEESGKGGWFSWR